MGDIPAICSLHEQFSDFPLPNFETSPYVLRTVSESNGRIIAAAALRRTSEAVLIMDLEAPRTERVRAIEGLLERGIFGANQAGIDEIHVFLTGEIIHSFERLLQQKFGFVPAKGVPLVLNLR